MAGGSESRGGAAPGASVPFPIGRLEGGFAPLTDDDGNAFVVLLGNSSCQPGKVTIEASLEQAESFNSAFGEFEIESPRPTT